MLGCYQCRRVKRGITAMFLCDACRGLHVALAHAFPAAAGSQSVAEKKSLQICKKVIAVTWHEARRQSHCNDAGSTTRNLAEHFLDEKTYLFLKPRCIRSQHGVRRAIESWLWKRLP